MRLIRTATRRLRTLDLSRDVRFAARSYRRTPGFTVVSLLTLALGIGTTTAAFSIIDAVLIRPLPYPESDRIVTLTGRDSLANDVPTVSAPNFHDWREQSRSFEAVALYATARRGIVSGGGAMHVETATVSGDFFRVMRLPAAMGRTLTPADANGDGAGRRRESRLLGSGVRQPGHASGAATAHRQRRLPHRRRPPPEARVPGRRGGLHP